MPGWERVRAQIDSEAVDTVGPKDLVRALELKETATLKRGVAFVASNGICVENYRKKVVGHTGDG